MAHAYEGWRRISGQRWVIVGYDGPQMCERLVSPDGATTAVLRPSGHELEQRPATAAEVAEASGAPLVEPCSLAVAQDLARAALLERLLAETYPTESAAISAATTPAAALTLRDTHRSAAAARRAP